MNTPSLKEDDSLRCLTPADLTSVVASSFFITSIKEEHEVIDPPVNQSKNVVVPSSETTENDIQAVYFKLESLNPEEVDVKEEPSSQVRKRPKGNSKEALYECALCDYKCRQKVRLRRHVLAHTGEKPFNWDEFDSRCQAGDRIKWLLGKPFRLLGYDEQLAVVQSQIPQPPLSDLKANHKEKDRSYVRTFHINNYKKYKWLAGSVRLQKLFCWPCLLFSTEIGPWSTHGFKNLNYLSSACENHGKTIGHIKACTLLQTFGTERLDYQSHLQKKIDDGVHNQKVRENRRVLRRLVDVVAFLGGRNEAGNIGKFEGLLDFLAPYDWALTNHLKSGSPDLSLIQVDLIDALAGVVADRIKLEVSQATFVAFLLDETSDVLKKSRLATVIRYVDGGGRVQERFLHFTDSNSNHTAQGLFEQVDDVVQSFECAKKLMVLTCDGASITTPGQLAELQTNIQNKYPTATFLHGHNQRLSATLAHSTSHLKECQVFFTYLSALSSFFLHSTNRVDAWTRFQKNNRLSLAPTDWTSSWSLLDTLGNNRLHLKDFFESVEDEPGDWTPDEALAASGFIRFLSKPDTKLLLSVFQPPLSLDNFQRIRLEGYKKLVVVDDDEPSQKRVKIVSTNRHEQIFDDVLEALTAQVKLQCDSKSTLPKFVSLLDSTNFPAFCAVFPDNLFAELGEPYGGFFDRVRLRSELKVLWGSDEYKELSVGDLTVYLKLNKLDVVFSEVYKLAELVSTIGVVQGGSAFERIRSYVKASEGQASSNSLAILSIEKDVFVNFKKYAEESFYEEVTSKFTRKETRMEFVYK